MRAAFVLLAMMPTPGAMGAMLSRLVCNEYISCGCTAKACRARAGQHAFAVRSDALISPRASRESMAPVLTAVGAQPALPKVTDVEWATVRQQCLRMLEALRKTETPLPADVERKLVDLLREDVKDQGEAIERLQEMLDPHCLVGIGINPESRVKVARGPAPADLVVNRPRLLLLKVSNDAGITAALAITGDELRTSGPRQEGRWLDVVLLAQLPLKKSLSGNRLEYVPIVLTAHEAGKREATLKFDAGQGTQDLGFRAEVPILFRVMGPK